MKPVEETYDIVVVGAGHAGCEAALSCARRGLETILFTVSVEAIALMPCNPNIGGSSKGHLVREVDALGGEMGKNIDATFIQSKMLNVSKGPAVHSLRAQADKAAYSMRMRHILEEQEHLTIRQQEVAEILTYRDLSEEDGIRNEAGILLEDDSARSCGKGENPTTKPVDIGKESADIGKDGASASDKRRLLINEKDGSRGKISEFDIKNKQFTQRDLSTKNSCSSVDNVDKNRETAQNQGGLVHKEVDNFYDVPDVPVDKVAGVRTVSGAVYHAKAVILCTGVYLASRCIYGETSQWTGPNGLMAATHLSDSLRSHGIRLVRFKTGTPARIDRRSIDFSKMQIQKGDERVVPFSFSTDPESVQIEQVPCYLTYTNEETHRVIRENIGRSPLYGGIIHATGPRYCPSIEDKVMKFPEKNRHQVFIEPEGRYTNEMYIDGMSSSMPEDVQFAMYRSVPGLENARIVRNAYAIEYDCLAPLQLKSSLEFKSLRGLFSGGQFNGSSGYEEAAAQGLVAGINAGNYCFGKEPLVLLRSEAYIGVLIDDLVTKENFEPYRMMTSRAEYRLLLRQDNADLRLRKYGYEAGLISEEQMNALRLKETQIREELNRLKGVYVGDAADVRSLMESYGSTPPEHGASLAELIRRPELDYDKTAPIDPERPALPDSVREQVNIEIKYEGYIERQKRQVRQFEKAEQRRIPDNLDYDDVPSLRLEARQKLREIRPSNIGQASRIAGVSPADVNVLMVYLKKMEWTSI